MSVPLINQGDSMRHTNHDINLLYKALNNSIRRSILRNLAVQDLSLSLLADTYGMSLQGVKRHLHVLQRCQLISAYHGNHAAMYRLHEPSILKLMENTAIWYNSDKSA